MYDVFLSYNSADKSDVEIIAKKLGKETGITPFLDQWYLIPGEPWQEALEIALEKSKATAIFIGPSGISPWHNEEVRNALNHSVRTRDDFRVIPVLLPGSSETSVTGFLARRTWVDFRKGLNDPIAFDRLIAGIKGEVRSSESYEIPDNLVPFRGLLPFDADQSEYFFGRDDDIERVINKLARLDFLAVIGASGIGKSSLVQAGVLPSIINRQIINVDEWNIRIFTPGNQPLRNLSDQISSIFPWEHRLEISDLLFERMISRHDGLRTSLNTFLANENKKKILIVIDQFEELFTLTINDSKSKEHISCLIKNLFDFVINKDGGNKLIITLRADFLRHCLQYEELRILLEDNQVLLSMLSLESLREAIIQPAQRVGCFFEQGLVSVVLRDVLNQPGALPLLQHALYELWNARDGPWLTFDAYHTIGGVAGALHQRANMVFDSLTHHQRSLAKNIFIRLTSLSDEAVYTRRRVARSELYPAEVDTDQVDYVISRLSGVDARLIISDEDKVEISHESLLDNWDVLTKWLEEERESIKIGRHLTKATEEWIISGKDVGELYRGKRLQVAHEWGEEHWNELTRVEQDFLESSFEIVSIEQAEKKRAEIINLVTSQITSSITLEELLNRTINTSKKILDNLNAPTYALVCVLFLFDGEKLFVGSALNLDPLDVDVTLVAENGILGKSFRSSRAEHATRLINDDELNRIAAFRDCGSFYFCPLSDRNVRFGILVFGHPEKDYFSKFRCDMLEVLGKQVVFALHATTQLSRDFEGDINFEGEIERIKTLQEETRKKLARDLHDGPTQSIAAIAMRVNFARRLMERDQGAAADELHKIEDLARRTTKEIRHMLFTLRPLVLEKSGLLVALESISDRTLDVYNQKVIIDVDQAVIDQIEVEKQSEIFYIIQEAVNNSRKFAEADNIWVRLQLIDETLVLLEIEDDGRGFVIDDVRNAYGIITMQERAEQLNGEFQITSQLGSGTKIKVLMPLNGSVVTKYKGTFSPSYLPNNLNKDSDNQQVNEIQRPEIEASEKSNLLETIKNLLMRGKSN